MIQHNVFKGHILRRNETKISLTSKCSANSYLVSKTEKVEKRNHHARYAL